VVTPHAPSFDNAICYAAAMIRRVVSTTLFLIVSISAAGQLGAPTAIRVRGYARCSRTSCLLVPDDEHPRTYRQGDLSYTVMESGKFTLSRGRKTVLDTDLKDLNASVFVVWSANSDWFAVTWSDGGAIGQFHTRVFHISDGNVNEAESVKNAFADFQSRHLCKTRGDNVQAYGWNASPAALVLVTSVYPTSDCGKDLGHTEAYLVKPTDGTILRHLSLREFSMYAKSHPQ
jgi:hypothetical protein